MQHVKYFLSISLIIATVGFCERGWAFSCPSLCTCDLWLQLKRASCNRRHLYSVHTGATDDLLRAVDLSENSISAIGDHEIAEAGLRNVKFLNLSNNAISEISLRGFRGLENLVILDLSKNHLRYLLEDIFLETKNLRVLELSGNNFNTHVPKLKSSSITDLGLASCQISHLPAGTFDELPKIRQLDISENMMIQLEIYVLRPLQFLHKISLKGNPWSCDNSARDLRDYLNAKSVEFNGFCAADQRPKKFEKMILRKSTERGVSSTTNRNVARTLPALVVNSTKLKNPPEVGGKTYGLPGYWVFIGGFFFGVILGAGTTCAVFSCQRKRWSRGRIRGFADGIHDRRSLIIFPENSRGGGGLISRQNSGGNDVLSSRENSGGNGVLISRQNSGGNDVLFSRQNSGGNGVLISRENSGGNGVLFSRENSGGNNGLISRENSGRNNGLIFTQNLRGNNGLILTQNSRRQNGLFSRRNSMGRNGSFSRQNSRRTTSGQDPRGIRREFPGFARNFRDPQRISLLDENSSCPGTPPPAYRDVILQPGLFPRTEN